MAPALISTNTKKLKTRGAKIKEIDLDHELNSQADRQKKIKEIDLDTLTLVHARVVF